MGTNLAERHRSCEKRLLESLPLREELAWKKVQCPTNHVVHYSVSPGSRAESCAKMHVHVLGSGLTGSVRRFIK
jgi:hypothetical protein